MYSNCYKMLDLTVTVIKVHPNVINISFVNIFNKCKVYFYNNITG